MLKRKVECTKKNSFVFQVTSENNSIDKIVI